MSEQEPQPSLHENCRNCGEGFFITKFNSALYFFTKQPEIILLDSVCGGCNVPDVGFIGRETAEWAIESGIPDSYIEYAPLEVHAAYLDWMGIPIIKPHPVTGRQENLLNFVAYLLQTEHIKIEDFNNEGELSI